MEQNKYHSIYHWLLWLFVIHSFLVAIGLIVIPNEYLLYFGFEDYRGRFFQVQAGVFHLVMMVAYLFALYQGEKISGIVYFVIIAKFLAMIFLLIYFVFIEHVWVILMSGVCDGAMGIMLWFIYHRLKRSIKV